MEKIIPQKELKITSYSDVSYLQEILKKQAPSYQYTNWKINQLRIKSSSSNCYIKVLNNGVFYKYSSDLKLIQSWKRIIYAVVIVVILDILIGTLLSTFIGVCTVAYRFESYYMERAEDVLKSKKIGQEVANILKIHRPDLTSFLNESY